MLKYVIERETFQDDFKSIDLQNYFTKPTFMNYNVTFTIQK